MTYKPFPAITVYQPWASLIAYSFKEFETRHWQPPQTLIGQLIAIHAGKKWTDQEKDWHKVYKQMFPEVREMPVPLGCIVAMCRLTEVVPSEMLVARINPREKATGNFDPGRYGWRLEVVKRADPPIAAQGKQGIWMWQREEDKHAV
jgi:hypothetical protein